MWNYNQKNPTIIQVKAIIEYITKPTQRPIDPNMGIHMTRPKPNLILLSIGDAGLQITFKVTFNDQQEIQSFEYKGSCIS